MIDWLATALIVGGLLIAAVAGISALRKRAPGRVTLGVAALTEIGLVVQGVVAVGVSFNGQRADSPVLFFAYFVAILAVLPASLLLARAEPNKFGSVIFVFGGFVVAILVVRMQQIWGTSVG